MAENLTDSGLSAATQLELPDTRPASTTATATQHVHHIRPATPNALLLQEIVAPFAPVVMVDEVEDVALDKLPPDAKPAGQGVAHIPTGDLELDEYPKNIVGEDVVIVDTPPDGGFAAWMVVAAAFVGNFVCVGIQQSFGIFLGYYLNVTFAGTVSTSQVALISSLQSGFAFILGPFVGRLTDYAGPRITCIVGMVIQVAANVAASYCTTIETLWATQGILFGIGTCFVTNAVISAPQQWFAKRLAFAFGISISGTGIGGLVLTFVTQAMLTKVGPAWTLRFYAILCAGLLIPASIALRTRAPPPGTIHRKRPFINWKLFADKKFLVVFFGMLLCSLAFPAPFYLPAYTYVVGIDPSIGANFLAIQTGVSALANFLAGVAIPKTGVLNLFCISQFLAAISTFIFWMPAGSNVALLYVYSIWWGLCWGCFFPTLAPAIAQLFSHLDVFPVVVGSIYLSIAIGFFTNGPLFGALVDAGTVYKDGVVVSVDYKWAQIWAGGIYLVGWSFICMVRMHEAKWKIVAKV